MLLEGRFIELVDGYSITETKKDSKELVELVKGITETKTVRSWALDLRIQPIGWH